MTNNGDIKRKTGCVVVLYFGAYSATIRERFGGGFGVQIGIFLSSIIGLIVNVGLIGNAVALFVDVNII